MVYLGFEPGAEDGRHRQIYWTTAAPQIDIFFVVLVIQSLSHIGRVC